MIPGLEGSPGEGIDYPLQYSWASPVAQLVKNLPAMQETWEALVDIFFFPTYFYWLEANYFTIL